MNIAILGFGKMGKGIASLIDKKHSIKFIIDPGKTENYSGAPVFKEIQDAPKELINVIDVFIEFTEPKASKQNLLSIMKAKKGAKIISGTTGWNVNDIDKEVNNAEALLLHSANFSFGVNVLASALNDMARSLSKGSDFEASMVEYHHKNKKDAPSGTAKMLASIMEYNDLKCPIVSVRTGSYPGTHIISFDSEHETIEIKHEARDRKVFCSGALIAAEWISKQDRPGIYKFSDII
ncbi:MAG: dihydrodipicolinate reductase C-terminal domain-containing protein [bacterium]